MGLVTYFVSDPRTDAMTTALDQTHLPLPKASAVALFESGNLIDDGYFIVGGASDGEGAVVSRARNRNVDTWMIDETDEKSGWYRLETNYEYVQNSQYCFHLDHNIVGSKVLQLPFNPEHRHSDLYPCPLKSLAGRALGR